MSIQQLNQALFEQRFIDDTRHMESAPGRPRETSQGNKIRLYIFFRKKNVLNRLQIYSKLNQGFVENLTKLQSLTILYLCKETAKSHSW